MILEHLTKEHLKFDYLNIDLTNYGQKNSIINIQDLHLSAANQHSVGGQPILWVIFRKLSISTKFFYF
jgi:hypothetical protein